MIRIVLRVDGRNKSKMTCEAQTGGQNMEYNSERDMHFVNKKTHLLSHLVDAGLNKFIAEHYQEMPSVERGHISVSSFRRAITAVYLNVS